VIVHAGLVPVAMVIPGGILPIDLALAVALPVHSHIALNFVSTRHKPTPPLPIMRYPPPDFAERLFACEHF
jgi:hypothetical protein